MLSPAPDGHHTLGGHWRPPLVRPSTLELRVDVFGAVGRGEHEYLATRLDAIKQDEKLGDEAFSLARMKLEELVARGRLQAGAVIKRILADKPTDHLIPVRAIGFRVDDPTDHTLPSFVRAGVGPNLLP